VWRLSHALCAPGLDQLLSARGRVDSTLDAVVTGNNSAVSKYRRITMKRLGFVSVLPTAIEKEMREAFNQEWSGNE